MGIEYLYTPEINSSDEITANAANTAGYDDIKVVAINNEIDGKTHDGQTVQDNSIAMWMTGM